MIKNLASAFLVFRLELRLLSVDTSLILKDWLRRPAIELMFDHFGRKSRIVRKLNQIYPF